MTKCADPVLCYTVKGLRKFVHFSLASPLVKAIHDQVFNCGRCPFCTKRKSYELATRCVLHASLYKQNCFLTLTHDETRVGYHNNFDYKEIQDFKKRFRNSVNTVEYSHIKTRKLKQRRVDPEFRKLIQIFNVHEYGANQKKHWHLVVFNHDFADKILHTTKNGNRLYKSEQLSKLWPHGFSTIGDVTEASAMYQAQYTQKDFKYGNTHNARKSHSKHSGIGREYFMQHYNQILRLGYVPVAGKKVPIPRYFLKIAHKHYSHYYETSNFLDLNDRRALYRPFKGSNRPRKDLADLYVLFRDQRKERISEIASEWEDYVNQNLFNTDKPDFLIAAENYLYDLNNRKQSGDL